MKLKLPDILLAGTLFVMVLDTTIFTTIMHERAHKMIYELYGVKSKIGFGFDGMFLTGYTIPNSSDIAQLSMEDYKEMKTLHLMNEIVAYNTHQFFFLHSFLFWIQIVILLHILRTLEGKYEGKDKRSK